MLINEAEFFVRRLLEAYKALKLSKGQTITGSPAAVRVDHFLTCFGDQFQLILSHVQYKKIGLYGARKDGVALFGEGFRVAQLPFWNTHIDVSGSNDRKARDERIANLCLLVGEKDWGATYQEFENHFVSAFIRSFKILVCTSDCVYAELRAKYLKRDHVVMEALSELDGGSDLDAIISAILSKLLDNKQLEEAVHAWVQYEYPEERVGSELIDFAVSNPTEDDNAL